MSESNSEITYSLQSAREALDSFEHDPRPLLLRRLCSFQLEGPAAENSSKHKLTECDPWQSGQSVEMSSQKETSEVATLAEYFPCCWSYWGAEFIAAKSMAFLFGASSP